MTVCATLGATTLIAEISNRAPRLPWVSSSHAAFWHNNLACSISMRDLAICSRTTPCSASRLPNAVRDFARSHMSDKAHSAAPIRRMQ